MSFWDEIGEIGQNFIDGFKDLGGSVGDFFSDPLGALEDAFNATLDIMTFGTWSYSKDALRGFVAGLIPEQTFQDRERNIRSASEPRQVIYGTVKTGGQIVYIEDQGKDNIVLWMCFVVAGHEVNHIKSVFADDIKIAETSTPGVNGVMNRVPGTQFDDNTVVWAIHGNRSSAFIPSAQISSTNSSYEGNFSPPNWTSSHRLAFQSYVWINLVFDKDAFGDTGIPKFTFEVEGKKLYDPRTGVTSFSDNQALAMLDVLLWERMFDESLSDVDAQDFINAANVADEQVASGVGTTEKRYTVNGTFKLQAVPLEILQSLAAAGASTPYFDISSGKWKVTPGSFESPVMSLDESDLVGGVSFQAGPSKNNRHNVAKGTYIDADQDYESVGFRELYIDQYVQDDLEELEKSYSFPWTNSGSMARRLAKIDIERNRFGISCKVVCKFKALQLAPGDRVELTVTRLGWTPKVFRVEGIEISFESGVALDLREDAAEIYDWEEGDALALDTPPVLSIPDGLNISPPSNIQFSEELYRTITRAAVKVRLIISWDEQPSAEAYDIQIKKQSEAKWVNVATFWQGTEIEADDVEDVPYDVRIRSINGIGRTSEYVQASYSVIGKSAPPPDVPLLFVEKKILKWTYPDEPVDLDGFILRFQNGDRRSWVDATPLHEGIVTETIFDVSEFSGTKTFLIKAIDTTGNLSENAAVLVQGLGDVPVENVVDSQNEAPDWASILDQYTFQVVSLGITQDFDLESGTADTLTLDSSASYTGAFVNGDGYLEATEIGVFYAEPDSLFYDDSVVNEPFNLVYQGVEEPLQVTYVGVTQAFETSKTDDFYGAQYEAIVYRYTFDVPEQDAGASLSVQAVLENGVNEKLDYKPPLFTGNFLAFPGSIESEAGEYIFKYTVPKQQSTEPPILQDIITRLDVGDIQERLGDVVIAAGGTRLPIVKEYREIVTVNLTLQDDNGNAVTLRVEDKDVTLGPLVQAFNSSGTSVSATVDALIQGF